MRALFLQTYRLVFSLGRARAEFPPLRSLRPGSVPLEDGLSVSLVRGFVSWFLKGVCCCSLAVDDIMFYSLGLPEPIALLSRE